MQSASSNGLFRSIYTRHLQELLVQGRAGTRAYSGSSISASYCIPPIHTCCTRSTHRTLALSLNSPSPPVSTIHTSSSSLKSCPPSHKNRGPPSKETTQTNFDTLNVLGGTPVPTTTIDACHSDGFLLNSGLRVSGGSGVLLVSGEVFSWRPWEAIPEKIHKGKAKLVNAKGQWAVPNAAWGLLDVLWPKPDLLILGIGPHMHPVAPEVRAHLNGLGIRLEIQDTRNAAAQFNLLATERGVGNVAAALMPMGWRDGR